MEKSNECSVVNPRKALKTMLPAKIPIRLLLPHITTNAEATPAHGPIKSTSVNGVTTILVT